MRYAGELADYRRILVRATNWIGDAIMSLPALRAIRERYPEAHIAVLARPWVADLYAGETAASEVIPYEGRGIGAAWRVAEKLRARRFDAAILLQNAFDAALIAWLARIPSRIGYRRDGRGLLLTTAVRVPKPGELPRHERFYYLEMLRRAGLVDSLPTDAPIRLAKGDAARRRGEELYSSLGIQLPVLAVSPGAAFGTAKRWLPERFAEAAAALAGQAGATVVVFGSAAERELCGRVAADAAARGAAARNLAGRTTLTDYIALAAAAKLYLTNDSGAMHIASALGVPTVTVFGATDHTTTGPTGSLARIVREPVECSPCLLRECPIDHRCMTRVTAGRVVREGRELMGMDTRRKILDAAAARALVEAGPTRLVSGYFDPLTAAHADRLAEIARAEPGRKLVVLVQPWEDALLDAVSRAELVAALRTVEAVVAGEEAQRLAGMVPEAAILHEERADEERRRQLVAHIRSRHEA